MSRTLSSRNRIRGVLVNDADMEPIESFVLSKGPVPFPGTRIFHSNIVAVSPRCISSFGTLAKSESLDPVRRILLGNQHVRKLHLLAFHPDSGFTFDPVFRMDFVCSLHNSPGRISDGW